MMPIQGILDLARCSPSQRPYDSPIVALRAVPLAEKAIGLNEKKGNVVSATRARRALAEGSELQ